MEEAGEKLAIHTDSPAVQKADRYILQLFQTRESARLLVHNYALSHAMIAEMDGLLEAEAERPSDPEILALQLAAFFLPTGRLTDYQAFVPHSLKRADQWMLSEQVPDGVRRTVLRLLERIGLGHPPEDPLEQVFSDACHIATYLLAPEERQALLRLEVELHGRSLSKKQWAEEWLDTLLKLPLYTQAAQLKYGPVRARLIQSQQKKLDKGIPDETTEAPGTRLFHGLEPRPPLRAAQTYFRVNYRNHINLSSIADNKANIMISVNSILISILFTLLTYGNVTQVQPIILVPAVIFILTGVVSLIFAILSARPKVTQLLGEEGNFADRQQHVMFFGNFVQMELEEYEEALDSVLNDGQLLYGNMARDLYFLGKVLDKKYRYLTLSYNIFMAGLVTAVLSFLLVLSI